MGQAMGSNGVHSAVPCETSQMQASLPGPLPWLGSRGTGCPLRFLSLTASLPCTHHTCTHPAFIQSPRCHATGDLGAGSAQAEPRVWARECEWGHSAPLFRCSTSPLFALLSLRHHLSSSSSIFSSSRSSFSTSPPPDLPLSNGGKGIGVSVPGRGPDLVPSSGAQPGGEGGLLL